MTINEEEVISLQKILLYYETSNYLFRNLSHQADIDSMPERNILYLRHKPAQERWNRVNKIICHLFYNLKNKPILQVMKTH
jgi:hypothetical protein